MRNFDGGRTGRTIPRSERAFIIGGETFHRRNAVRPEAISVAEDATDHDSSAVILQELDKAILLMIEPDGHDRWIALRAREDDPIVLTDVTDVIQWLIGEFSRRPTVPPQPSTTGPSPTTEPAASTDGSPPTTDPTPTTTPTPETSAAG